MKKLTGIVVFLIKTVFLGVEGAESKFATVAKKQQPVTEDREKTIETT